MTILRLDTDKITAAQQARVIRNFDDFKHLEDEGPFCYYKPTAYPALYVGSWQTDPNGPDGIYFEELIAGEGLEIIDGAD